MTSEKIRVPRSDVAESHVVHVIKCITSSQVAQRLRATSEPPGPSSSGSYSTYCTCPAHSLLPTSVPRNDLPGGPLVMIVSVARRTWKSSRRTTSSGSRAIPGIRRPVEVEQTMGSSAKVDALLRDLQDHRQSGDEAHPDLGTSAGCSGTRGRGVPTAGPSLTSTSESWNALWAILHP